MTKRLKKIATAITIVLTLNLIVPTYSHAVDLTLGGILMKPFSFFIGGTCDIINTFWTAAVIGISNGSDPGFTKEMLLEKIRKEDPMDGVTPYEVTVDAGGHISTAKTYVQSADDKKGAMFLSMEDFFLGNLDIANINIFSNMNQGTSAVQAIKKVVAEWYYSLRNVAALGLLCALIYTVIRILLSTIASDQAQYKEKLIDWLKATCLVIFVHILMIFILWIMDKLLLLISTGTTQYALIEYVRGQLSFLHNWDVSQLGYLVLYVILTYYTICFTFSYFRRFLYTLILILIAPIVSLMYAFGKQGKEIFSKWLKEFTCNAFLQPYHLLIYTILFGFVGTILKESSGDFLACILATIIAFFIRDAEKYFRSLFGMGSGIAGIGAVDTGEKKIKDIGNKIINTAKSVAQIGAIAATGGLAAGMGAVKDKAGENVSALMEGQGELENASNPGASPSRTGDRPGDEPGGDSSGGDSPEPDEPEDPDSGTDSGGSGSGEDSGGDSGSGEGDREGSGSSDGDSESSGSSDDDSGSDETVVENIYDDATGVRLDSIEVGEINAEKVEAEKVEAGDVDAKAQKSEKVQTRFQGNLGDAIDGIASAISGQDIHFAGNMQSAKQLNRELKEDPDVTRRQRRTLTANEFLNRSSQHDSLDSSSRGETTTVRGAAPSRGGDVNANVSNSTNAETEVQISSGSTDIGQVKEALKQMGINANTITPETIDKIAEGVAHKTGKSQAEVKEVITQAMPKSESSSTDTGNSPRRSQLGGNFSEARPVEAGNSRRSPSNTARRGLPRTSNNQTEAPRE